MALKQCNPCGYLNTWEMNEYLSMLRGTEVRCRVKLLNAKSQASKSWFILLIINVQHNGVNFSIMKQCFGPKFKQISPFDLG